MDEKITAHSSKEEREKVLKEIRQLENRKKILENKQRNEERRVRTRRLIERGAILEGIFPLAPNLSGAEVKAFLIALSHLPGFGDEAIEVSENFGHSVRIAGRGSCDGIVVQQGPWLFAMARHGNHAFILDLSVSKNAVLRRWIEYLELLRSRAFCRSLRSSRKESSRML